MDIEFYKVMAEVIPQALEQIKEIIAKISDNKLILRLSILSNNYNLVYTKLCFYFSVWENDTDKNKEVALGCMKSIDDLIKWNQELAEIIGSTKIGERYSAWTKIISDYSSYGLQYIKEHPETVAAIFLPFGTGTSLLGGGLISIGIKLLDKKN